MELTTTSRLLSGLGNGHPFETGFIWHRSLGVPFLPGSSVKGLLRAWLQYWSGAEGAELKKQIDELFGPDSENDSPSAAAGSLIVFDALPLTPPKLQADILTPHYGPYYDDPVKNPPADWYSPVPVHFLTVAEGTKFLFGLAPRPGAWRKASREEQKEKKAAAMRQGVDLLLEALEYLGAGGKTAVGYGTMTEQDMEKRLSLVLGAKKQEEQEERARLATVEKEMKEQGLTGKAKEIALKAKKDGWGDDNASLLAGMEEVLTSIELENEVDKRAMAEYLAELLDNKYTGVMREPEKRGGKKKNKPQYKPRPKAIAITLRSILGIE